MCRIFIFFAFNICWVVGSAQADFDECTAAFVIQNPLNYCSEVQAFDNTNNSISSNIASPACFTSSSGDIWFRFNPLATDVLVSINGASSLASGGTLRNPQVAIYYRSCGINEVSELQCESDQSGNNIIELYQGGLAIGDDYYLRVSGANNQIGTFQICINNYFAPRVPGSDCSSAAILCDQSSFTLESVIGAGFDPTELNGASCFEGGVSGVNFETNSSWFKWICRTSGQFTFQLTPTNPIDDLDFILYELVNGLDDCDNKEILRCEAAGENPALFPSACHGPTGLSVSANDISEPPGCMMGQDNFIAAIDLEAGKSYALVVNNYTSTGNGFTIDFGGTSVFEGPEANFVVDPTSGLKCEESFSLMDSTEFSFGSIEGYQWFFGIDASPAVASDMGPHSITYGSFGQKVITLQVETDRGCIVSTTKEIFVEPCCEDLPDLRVDTKLTDLTCYEIPTGIIQLEGDGGTPGYKYSLDNESFDFNSLFTGLESGNYLVKVLDAHGCQDSTMVTLGQPEKLIVDAGEDIASDLGVNVEFNATYGPARRMVNGTWISSNGDSIRCLDPLCLSIEVLPPGPTDYIITIEDETGCLAMDTVSAIVEISRDISYPNVFSPNQDGLNDYFNLFGSISAVDIDVLRVFDRWGGLVYEGFDIPLNDRNRGWDGAINGSFVNPGVFTFVAMIEFVDRQIIPFSGNVTVVR